MINLLPSHVFRQAQYDSARCQSEPVEDFAIALNKMIS